MSALPRRSPELAPGYSKDDVRDSVATLEQRPCIPEKTPASASADGYEGEFCADDNYFYRYRNGGWKRAALSSW